MTYSEKLRDPRWQRKRLEVFQYADFRCQVCGSSSKTLNVHHSYYEKGREPWDYPNGSLISACEECHEIIETHVKHKLPSKPVSQPARCKTWKGLTIPEDHLVRIAFYFPEVRSEYDWFYENLTNVQNALKELDAEGEIPSHWPRNFKNIPEPRKIIEDMARNSLKCSVSDMLERLCKEAVSLVDECEQMALLQVSHNLRELRDSSQDIKTKHYELDCLFNNDPVLYRLLAEKRVEDLYQ